MRAPKFETATVAPTTIIVLKRLRISARRLSPCAPT